MNSILSPHTRTGYIVLGIVVVVVGTLIVDVLRNGGVAPPAQSPQGATQPPADEVRRLELERQREAEREQEERRQVEERRLAAQKAETERLAEEQRKAEELRSEAEQFPFGRTFSVVARVAINSAVATDRSRVGDIIGALPIEPIAFGGDSSVSAPSEFSLRVAALAPRSGDREAAIVLEPVRLNLQDGRVFIIEGESIVVAKDESARGDWLKRLGKIAIGAGVGAAVGAALGGKGKRAEGAALGATAGGAVASGTLITRRNHIEAPRGYPLVFTMSSARLSQSPERGRLTGQPPPSPATAASRRTSSQVVQPAAPPQRQQGGYWGFDGIPVAIGTRPDGTAVQVPYEKINWSDPRNRSIPSENVAPPTRLPDASTGPVSGDAVPDLVAYCKGIGYQNATNVDGTGYGWRCVPGSVSLDVDRACQQQYGARFKAILVSQPPGAASDWRCVAR